MRSKRYTIHHLLCLVAAAVATIACNTVGEDERLIYVEPADIARAVLIEDFTGQNCSNCPDAAAEIEKIKAEYPEGTIISVAIHGGPLARYSTSRVVGLRTELGDEYLSHWGVENTLPKGYVSRTGTPTNYDQWTSLVREAAKQRARVQLSATAKYDEVGHDGEFLPRLIITIKALGVDETAVRGNLQLWLTESGITALQSMPDGTRNPAYVHNHVLRAAVNGAWGEPIELAAGADIEKTYAYTPDASWLPANLSLVAFVYDDSGVLQVIEQKVEIEN